MFLVCSKCGQGDFGWCYKCSQLWCDFCNDVTRWIKKELYLKRKEKEQKKNELITTR